jgi:hypothetical protein
MKEKRTTTLQGRLSLFSGTQAEKVGNPKKKKIVKTVKEPKKPNIVP